MDNPALPPHSPARVATALFSSTQSIHAFAGRHLLPAAREQVSALEPRVRAYFQESLAPPAGMKVLIGGSAAGASEAMAMMLSQAQLPLVHRVDLSQVMLPDGSETEKQLDLLFRSAADAGWILFFDEADALFGKRSEVRDAHDRYASTEVNYLLQRLEAYRGLVIVAGSCERCHHWFDAVVAG